MQQLCSCLSDNIGTHLTLRLCEGFKAGHREGTDLQKPANTYAPAASEKLDAVTFTVYYDVCLSLRMYPSCKQIASKV